jgi:hypothetical protein
MDFSSGTHHVTGFHGRAELCGHGATVYLLPGMTRRQRNAVLRRLRMEASRGYGPALPLAELVFALAVDRVRTGLRITVGVVRLHPSRTLLPSAAAVLLMAFFVLASAGSRIEFTPRAGLDGLVSGGGVSGGGVAGGAAAVSSASQFDREGAKATFGPVAGGEAAAVAAGLPAGQWTVKPSVLGHAASPQRPPAPRVERACFGAMPGVGSAQGVQLACKATTPPAGG